MITLEDKLKNPVWYSLNETHKKFAIKFDGVQFYNPGINNFGAFSNANKTKKSSIKYSEIAKKFFFVSENQTPLFDDNKLILEKKINGCQMVLDKLIDVDITEKIVLRVLRITPYRLRPSFSLCSHSLPSLTSVQQALKYHRVWFSPGLFSTSWWLSSLQLLHFASWTWS